jgi:2-keto-3-deoxy-L-rhamnonate aldolase RhmA
MGTRSFGPGQFETIYAGVTADYRRSYNDNLVPIAIVSTVEGAYNADEIAKVRGIHALFLDSMNLESSSGYLQGHPNCEKLARAIREAAGKGVRSRFRVDRYRLGEEALDPFLRKRS